MAPDVSRQNDSFRISPLREDELEAFIDVDAAAFGARMSQGFLDLVLAGMSRERVAVSRDSGEVVGSAASERTMMTVPGLRRVPTAMVVAVAVLPSHRRQGRLRALMRYQLDDIRGRGEIAAALYASEGGIYGRFGYGPSTFGSTYVVDKRIARLARPIEEMASGRVRLLSRDRAAEAFPAVYADYAPTRAGELDRHEIEFAGALGEPASEELGRRFYAAYEEDDRLDGYVGYEVTLMEPPSHNPRRLVVHELCTLTPAAYAAIWAYLLGVDLTVELRARGRPIDEPVRWLLDEPRQLRCVQSGDRTWVRLLDVGLCLGARRYAASGDLVIGVSDPFCPWNAGGYRIVVGEEGGPAEVERTSADPDLELDASTLASIYLGGVSPVVFADAGRITQPSPGALAVARRMFADERPPYCTTAF